MSAVIDAEYTEKPGSQMARVSSGGEMFLPAMSMVQAVDRYNAVLEFTKEIMKDGKDFGEIPGTNTKPCLLKPGAEKLCSFFGLTTKFIIIEKEEDWLGERHAGEPFFYYHYKVQLLKGDYLLGEADGSCNSMESKYRYRWVQEDQVPPEFDKKKLKRRGGRISEPKFAVDKAETGGKYGKPMEHWQAFRDAIDNGTATEIQKPKKDGGTMPAWEIDSTLFRVPNPDVADQVNAINKMAQKRAMIAAVLIVCNASEYFTQDLEDLDHAETGHAPTKPAAKPQTNGAHHDDDTPVKTIPPADVKNIRRWIAHVIADESRVCAFYEIARLEDLPVTRGKDCYEKLQAKFAEFMPQTPNPCDVPDSDGAPRGDAFEGEDGPMPGDYKDKTY